MRLIDADDFRNWLLKQNRLSKDYTIMMLDETPTIDPVEHGHVVWRERQFTGPKYQRGTCLKCGQEAAFILPPMEYDEVPYCSQCGARLSDDFQDYCPKCGAKLGHGLEQIKSLKPEGEEVHDG